jgi:hypothetical protein
MLPRQEPSVGICALCGKTGTLISSHYLAAAFFRRLHSKEGEKVIHPISLDARRMILNCNQPRTKLLCGNCEHRFKVQGEDWVIKCTCQKDGRFPLRDLLLRNTPIGQVGPTSSGRRADIYTGNGISEINHREIIYFAASVFWRGWVFDWSQVSDHSQIDLPPKLGLEFRDFLLGKSLFPSVVLQVEVALNPAFSRGNLGIIFPDKIAPRIPNPDPKPVGYFFQVFGLTFSLYFDLGKTAGMKTKVTSIAEPPHVILLTDVRMMEASASYDVLESTAKRVGQLARSSNRSS